MTQDQLESLIGYTVLFFAGAGPLVAIRYALVLRTRRDAATWAKFGVGAFVALLAWTLLAIAVVYPNAGGTGDFRDELEAQIEDTAKAAD